MIIKGDHFKETMFKLRHEESVSQVELWGSNCRQAVHGVAKSRTRLSAFTFTFPFHALEKDMAFLITLSDGYDGFVQKPNPQLLTQGIQDRSHQECTEQALGHGSQRINAVAPERNDHIFSSEETFDFFHVCFTSLSTS